MTIHVIVVVVHKKHKRAAKKAAAEVEKNAPPVVEAPAQIPAEIKAPEAPETEDKTES